MSNPVFVEASDEDPTFTTTRRAEIRWRRIASSSAHGYSVTRLVYRPSTRSEVGPGCLNGRAPVPSAEQDGVDKEWVDLVQ